MKVVHTEHCPVCGKNKLDCVTRAAYDISTGGVMFSVGARCLNCGARGLNGGRLGLTKKEAE